MSFLRAIPSLFALSTLLAACSGSVVIDGSSSSSGGPGGGGTGKVCSSEPSELCAPDEWCQWDTAEVCGGLGTCQKRPTSCDEPCGFVAVCGCDSGQYCSPCEAHMAGVDVMPGTTCLATVGIQYSAHGLFTDVPRYAIFKKDFDNNRCTRILVAMVGSPGNLGIQTTKGWAVEWAEITPSAADCTTDINGFPIPTMQAIGADGGKGDIKQDSDVIPCSVSIHAGFTFPPGAPWAPGFDQLDADNLFLAEFCLD